MRIWLLAPLALLLPGCLARTAVDIVTLPVKATSRTVDLLTESQSEADEKRGRRIRQHEECIGKEDRRARRENRAPEYDRCEE